MNQQFLDAIRTSLQTHADAPQHATDVYTYCETIATDLVERTDLLKAFEVLREPKDTVSSITISKQPFAAVIFTQNGDDAQVGALLAMWGDAVGRLWLEARAHETSVLIEQLTTIIEELWSAASTDADEALNQVCRRIVAAMPNIDRVGIVMNDEAAGVGVVKAAFPLDTIGQPIKLSDYEIHSRLKQSRAPLRIDDTTASDELLGPNKAILAAFAVKSILIIPVFLERELIGSVGFDAIKQPHHFSEEEVRLLQAVVRQIALFLKNQRSSTVSSTPLNTAQQDFLNQLVQSVPLRTDVESLFKTTAETIGHMLGASTVGVHLSTNLQEASNQETD